MKTYLTTTTLRQMETGYPRLKGGDMSIKTMPKQFNPTKEMINAAEFVYIAMAWVRTVRPIVRRYQKAILEKYQFKIAARWQGSSHKADEIILAPEQSYLLEDVDFKVYLDECNQARIKAGLHVDDPEFCPLLVAEEKLIKAEDTLIDVMEPLTGISWDDLMCSEEAIENRKRFVDLTLRLLAPFVKKKDMLLRCIP